MSNKTKKRKLGSVFPGQNQRPQRVRKKTRRLGDNSIALKLLKVGYKAFDAAVSINGDGSESTEVTLYVYSGRRLRKQYIGRTGKGHGHAEMDALYQFVKDKTVPHANVSLELSCTAKPCCVRCSAVLGLLNVSTANDNTHKSPKAMGSTQWGIPDEVAEYVASVTEIDCDAEDVAKLSLVKMI